MIVVMEMTNGKIMEDEFGRFEDEVLNAEWLPPCPELQLGLQEAVPAQVPTVPLDIDADDYLARVYRSQE